MNAQTWYKTNGAARKMPTKNDIFMERKNASVTSV